MWPPKRKRNNGKSKILAKIKIAWDCRSQHLSKFQCTLKGRLKEYQRANFRRTPPIQDLRIQAYKTQKLTKNLSQFRSRCPLVINQQTLFLVLPMQRTNIHKEVSLTQTTTKLEEVMAIEVARERATEASDRRSSIVFSLLSNS